MSEETEPEPVPAQPVSFPFYNWRNHPDTNAVTVLAGMYADDVAGSRRLRNDTIPNEVRRVWLVRGRCVAATQNLDRYSTRFFCMLREFANRASAYLFPGDAGASYDVMGLVWHWLAEAISLLSAQFQTPIKMYRTLYKPVTYTLARAYDKARYVTVCETLRPGTTAYLLSYDNWAPYVRWRCR